jgi:anti-sigma regulatory factor (Ser/Thr protein kinase)
VTPSSNHREGGENVSRTEAGNVTTHEFANGLVEHRWVNLSSDDKPQVLAREQVRLALSSRASGSRSDEAVLVADELVTNALQHTDSGPACLNLDVYQDIAVMWVHDGGNDADQVRVRTSGVGSCTELSETGRGLYLVDVLAAKWFVWPTADGKAVVAVIELDGEDVIPPTGRRDPATRAAGS